MTARVTDWDAAFDNDAGVPPGAPDFYTQWASDAAAFRAQIPAGQARMGLAYGPSSRQRLDLFLPSGTPHGLMVFVHGGYWQMFDGSFWSHFSMGGLARGFAVAVPTYRLAPEVRLTRIAEDIASAVTLASGLVGGPIHLTGHSAGGHLVARLATTTSPLTRAVRDRIKTVVSISGLHDLRPFLAAPRRNSVLRLDEREAAHESPALLRPIEAVKVTAWVGALEVPEMRRQADLLADAWRKLGADLAVVHEPGRHHYDVIDGLLDPDHPLTVALLG